MGTKWIFIFLAVFMITEVFCEERNPNNKASLFNFITIRRVPNASIITSSLTSKSLTQCAFLCSQYESRSLYYAEGSGICHCNKELDEGQEDPDAVEIKYGSLMLEESRYSDFVKTSVWPLRKDCLELFNDGHVTYGVYSILSVSGSAVETWCDMTSGGWTVFQRRQDGSEHFYRGWSDYVTGFGDRHGEYWLGLEIIHILTAEASELHVFLDTFGDVTPKSADEQYSTFMVSDAASKYFLTVDGYTGTCGSDSLLYSLNSKFSTYDSDNDGGHQNCAQAYNGAWWYNNCHHSNLNGLYLKGKTVTAGEGMTWKGCWGHYYSVKTSVMKTKRKV